MFRCPMRAKVGLQRWGRLCRLCRLCRSRLLAAVILLAAAPGCQTNPVTGKTQLNLLSTQQEIAIGQQSAPEYIKAFGGEIDDTSVRQYVNNIGQRLAALSHLPDLPWTFHVVDSDVVNAFAMPGGQIFITRGILAMFENESELAAVLGHEIGHVTHRHGAQQMSNAAVLDLGLTAGAVASGAEGEQLRRIYNIGSQVGTLAWLLPHSRRFENESDAVGLEYMVAGGYDPRGMVSLLEKLAREGGSARPPLFLSTHPYPEDRARAVRGMIDRRYADVTASGTLRIGEAEYRQYVLAALAKLPPPRHKGGES